MNRYHSQLTNLRWVLSVLVAQTFMTQSFAQTPPSELARISPATVIGQRLTADVRLGKLRIQFEKAGLLTVGIDMHNLAIGQAHPKGDERGYSWLCFTVARTHHTERWWLMSDAEFGGAPDYAITGVFAERVKSSVVSTTSCPAPPSQFLPASLDKHLWVGSQVSEIKSLLGSRPPSAGWHRYSNLTKQIDASGTEWFVQSWLDVKVEAGIIVALRAVQMTSS